MSTRFFVAVIGVFVLLVVVICLDSAAVQQRSCAQHPQRRT